MVARRLKITESEKQFTTNKAKKAIKSNATNAMQSYSRIE